MPKILMLDPAPDSAVAFYRSSGPFSNLHKLDPHIQCQWTERFNWWQFYTGTDILYCQRPFDNNHLKVIKEAKEWGIKIWVDTDDLLHEIPKYNPYYKVFNNPKDNKKEIFEESMKEADIITVTTQKLKDYYTKFNKNIEILENAHNDYAFPFKKHIGKPQNMITWRGSTTHRMDILSVAEQMVNVSRSHKDWTWVFLGNDLWYITEIIKSKAIEIPEKPIIEYYEILRNMGSAILIVPLLDNEFNRAKSSIAYQEATYGGMVTIAPDLPEFDRPGCIKYKDPSQFAYLLEKCIKSRTFREENYEKAYDYIKENLLLSKVNQKRLDIIHRLIES